MSAKNGDGQRVGVTQIGYLGLGVADTGAWREFATSVLGLQENGTSADGDLFIRMDEYHHRFILMPDDADDLRLIGWEVKDSAALDTMAAQLRAFGLTVEEGSAAEASRRLVRRLIKFTDPDGIPTEIYYGPLIDHTPFVSPRGIKSFVAGALGFGHVVIAVDDTERYASYLTDVLGARVSDHIAVPIGPMTLNVTFLHVNPRHHSIALAPKREVPGGARKRLQHMMIEADTIDAVGMALGLFQQRGLPAGALGRHVNDRMLSFYGETPSGFHIEYGFGGMLIEDEDKWNVQTWHSPSIWGHGMPRPSIEA